MRLDRIDWPRAVDSARVAHSATARLPDVLSLGAIHHDDAALAFAWLDEARNLAPLDPLVSLRAALAQVRFGEAGRALAIIDAMPYSLRQSRTLMRAKIVANLRGGEPRRAANVARELLEHSPEETSIAFLSADASMRMGELKAAENRLMSAPRGLEYAAAWADALCKLVLARPHDTKFVAGQLGRGALPKGSPCARLVEQMLEWAHASDAELLAAIDAAPESSSTEELLVTLLVTKARTSSQALLPKLMDPGSRWSERPSIRRACVAAVTARAVEASGEERWDEALRLVEFCLRHEPHDRTHHQNRAALLTLTAEHVGAWEAWAALDRHHVRLALAGRITAADVRSFARLNRMLADLSRVTPREPTGAQRTLGVFAVKETRRGDLIEQRLVPNEAQIDSDPEQLRQWIHHRRAELAWGALASFPDVPAVLSHPPDSLSAKHRISALVRMAGSLAVLVPDEGERLAAQIIKRFEACRGVTQTSYLVEPLHPAAHAQAVRWVSETADAALLARMWRPDPRRADLVEELVSFLQDCAAFVDVRALSAAHKAALDNDATAVRDLVAFVRFRLGTEAEVLDFDATQWSDVVRALTCQARLGMVMRAYDDGRVRGVKEAQEWISVIERARTDDPTDPVVEYWSVLIAIQGRFWDDARDAVRAFHRKAGPRPNPLYADQMEKYRRHIETESAQRSEGARRSERGEAQIGGSLAIAELEAASLADPTSIAIYESLAAELARVGRYAEANDVSERALSRCLGRQAQLRARKLSLEIAGLQSLYAYDAPSARLYLAGTRAAAMRALSSVPPESRTYPLEYLTGIAALSMHDPALAERSFVRALSACSRPLHLAILRPLAGSVERAAVDALRETVAALLDARRQREAVDEVLRTMASLSEPEACLVDLARTELALALAELAAPSSAQPALEMPDIALSWVQSLRRTLAATDRLGGVDAIAELAWKLHEPSRKEAAAVRERVVQIRTQIALTKAIDRSTQLLADGKAAEALSAIEGVDGETTDSRVLRQRAMILLVLGRFDEADAVVAALSELKGDATAEALVTRWSDIRFRRRTAAVVSMIRTKDLAGASDALTTLTAPSASADVELAYLRAFVLATRGYSAHKDGERARARELIREALVIVDHVVQRPEARTHTSLIELHARLDEDLEKLEEMYA